MGTFEKLGILVIVVIIVMILAVAIYQWGGTGSEPGAVVGNSEAPLVIHRKLPDDYRRSGGDRDGTDDVAANGDEDTWEGGIPKRYEIRANDKVWSLVYTRWGLRDSFIQRIRRANPDKKMARLQIGDVLVIPNPARYRRGTRTDDGGPANARRYEVQEGDKLESIARKHLGKPWRWKEILELNPGLEPRGLRVGQVIWIPAR